MSANEMANLCSDRWISSDVHWLLDDLNISQKKLFVFTSITRWMQRRSWLALFQMAGQSQRVCSLPLMWVRIQVAMYSLQADPEVVVTGQCAMLIGKKRKQSMVTHWLGAYQSTSCLDQSNSSSTFMENVYPTTPFSSVTLQVTFPLNGSTNVDSAVHLNTPFRHALISAALWC